MCIGIEGVCTQKGVCSNQWEYSVAHVAAIVGRTTCWDILMGPRRVVVNGNGEKCMTSVKNGHTHPQYSTNLVGICFCITITFKNNDDRISRTKNFNLIVWHS